MSDLEQRSIASLVEDNRRLRPAGLTLAEASLHVVREYDGVHRLADAVSKFAEVVSGEGGRRARFVGTSFEGGFTGFVSTETGVQLEFQSGSLVKVDGHRQEYFSGTLLLSLLKKVAESYLDLSRQFKLTSELSTGGEVCGLTVDALVEVLTDNANVGSFYMNVGGGPEDVIVDGHLDLVEMCRALNERTGAQSLVQVGYIYEHDGVVYDEDNPASVTEKRRDESWRSEPWTERPVYTLTKSGSEKSDRKPEGDS